jgi:nicotinamide-nucleotide amidase
MAQGVRRLAGADLAVAITGIAGPGGGSEDKPVGTVWLALSTANETWVTRHRFGGDRDQVRVHAAYVALDLVRRCAARLPRSEAWTTQETRRVE